MDVSEDDGWNVSLEAEFVVAVSLPDLLDWMSAMDGVHGTVLYAVCNTPHTHMARNVTTVCEADSR